MRQAARAQGRCPKVPHIASTSLSCATSRQKTLNKFMLYYLEGRDVDCGFVSFTLAKPTPPSGEI